MPWTILAILGGLALLIAMYAVGIYNRLVTLKNRFENAFSQIEVQLKRRYDLIPNLVEVAKGYMAHEKDTLEAVINARNQAVGGLQQASANPGDAASMQALVGAENMLSGALGKLFALSEAYPDLKANENMAQLTEELTSTETAWRLPGRLTTTRRRSSIPIARVSHRFSLPAWLASAQMPSCWSSTAKQSRKRQRFHSEMSQ